MARGARNICWAARTPGSLNSPRRSGAVETFAEGCGEWVRKEMVRETRGELACFGKEQLGAELQCFKWAGWVSGAVSASEQLN